MDIGSLGTERNKAVVAEFDKLIGSDDLSPLDRLCRSDMGWLPTGRRGWPALPRVPRDDGSASNDPSGLEQACCRGRGRLRRPGRARHGRWHGGSFLGIDAPPGDYDRDFAAMYRLVEGQIAERWAIRDDLGMLRQLGAVPSR
jgi:hypothetical protein